MERKYFDTFQNTTNKNQVLLSIFEMCCCSGQFDKKDEKLNQEKTHFIEKQNIKSDLGICLILIFVAMYLRKRRGLVQCTLFNWRVAGSRH